MGSMERKHWHIVETGLSLLTTANVPFSLWDSAFETATYLINRLQSKVTHKRSPYEYLFNISHDYKFLKIFGCECWPFLLPYNSNKLAFRSTSCVFIGYSKNHLGYKYLHIPSGKVYIARHVVFNEINFPFKNSTPIISSSTPPESTIVSISVVPPSPIPTSSHHNEAPQNPSLELSPNTSNSLELTISKL
jgi:hypothetical protein